MVRRPRGRGSVPGCRTLQSMTSRSVPTATSTRAPMAAGSGGSPSNDRVPGLAPVATAAIGAGQPAGAGRSAHASGPLTQMHHVVRGPAVVDWTHGIGIGSRASRCPFRSWRVRRDHQRGGAADVAHRRRFSCATGTRNSVPRRPTASPASFWPRSSAKRCRSRMRSTSRSSGEPADGSAVMRSASAAPSPSRCGRSQRTSRVSRNCSCPTRSERSPRRHTVWCSSPARREPASRRRRRASSTRSTPSARAT